jgi:hypothetical protein
MFDKEYPASSVEHIYIEHFLVAGGQREEFCAMFEAVVDN